MKIAAFLFAFTLIAGGNLTVADASASGYGPYSYISNEVSASYAQVAQGTWTWKFLNNSTDTTITAMTFLYTDKNGQHSKALPGQLKPGTAFGGGSAFSASSRPTITIKAIKRAAT